MFNLFISNDPDSWASSPYVCDRSRAVVEYTADEISERYKFFDESTINELKKFPLYLLQKKNPQCTGFQV